MPVRQMVKTLSEICNHQGRTDLIEIFENAHAQYIYTDYDNWNGGTYCYRLQISLATGLFAIHQTKIDELEGEIKERIGSIDKVYENYNLSEVMITPLAEDSTVYGQRRVPSEAVIKHIWGKGYFRLFLSHLSLHKLQVHQLKAQLRYYGIDAFVAHDDIQPSREWRDEIELALRSMDSLAALVTPKFNESDWCDQEIGWAFGRGIPVLAVRLGCDPYGFAGKYQAISGSLENPQVLAHSILEALKNKPETQRTIYRALPNALFLSPSYSESIALAKMICEYGDYTDSEKELIWKACNENDQVYVPHRVKSSLYAHIGSPPTPKEEETPD